VGLTDEKRRRNQFNHTNQLSLRLKAMTSTSNAAADDAEEGSQKKWVENQLHELEQAKATLMQEVDKLSATLEDREKTMTSLQVANKKTFEENKKL
jgi:hypothetical protein